MFTRTRRQILWQLNYNFSTTSIGVVLLRSQISSWLTVPIKKITLMQLNVIVLLQLLSNCFRPLPRQGGAVPVQTCALQSEFNQFLSPSSVSCRNWCKALYISPCVTLERESGHKETEAAHEWAQVQKNRSGKPSPLFLSSTAAILNTFLQDQSLSQLLLEH